ncbi:hypothetical protein [Prosthecobacter dejongeii]|uniref:Lipoprotein n=1 Tax=Prosthecobacter dejongeii TaxID=48465 RepID=A0A7W8DP15_9BACT|nr:hypothetical protein [Prosthecobacter dejongeii]MBB5036486.1 hypothetical protein [Prosthecobacter dejongeii]
MKSIVYLTLSAMLAFAFPSCTTNVNAGGGASVKHGKAKHSHHQSKTGVKANVGASLGL